MWRVNEVEGGPMIQTSSCKIVSLHNSWDVMDSSVTMVNNIVLHI